MENDETVDKKARPSINYGKDLEQRRNMYKDLEQRRSTLGDKVKTLSITLNGESPFSPGEIISGVVETNFFRAERVSELVVRVLGKGRVTWEEKVPIEKRKYKTQLTVTCNNEEVYLDLTKYIIQAKEEKDFQVIPGGNHYFPFEFGLPAGLPSSFDEFGATVEYLCFVIATKMDKPKQRAVQTFMVSNPTIDLNLNPELNGPKAVSNHTEIHRLCCWKAGKVGFTFKLDKTGFIPGEAVECSVHLYNNSNRKISRIEVYLNRVIRLFANQRMYTYIVPILINTKPGIKGYENEIQTGNFLDIPVTPPINLAKSNIIAIQYCVKFVMVIPGNKDLSGVIPIQIGTIPLPQKDLGVDTADFPDSFDTITRFQDVAEAEDKAKRNSGESLSLRSSK